MTGTSAEAVVIKDCWQAATLEQRMVQECFGSPASHLSDSAFQPVLDEPPAPIVHDPIGDRSAILLRDAVSAQGGQLERHRQRR